ncbi:MAG: hypothetical protein ACR2P1_09190, partial [Pseudomonadales bacterium]
NNRAQAATGLGEALMYATKVLPPATTFKALGVWTESYLKSYYGSEISDGFRRVLFHHGAQ